MRRVPESGTLGRAHADSACAADSLQPSPRGLEVSGEGQETGAGGSCRKFSPPATAGSCAAAAQKGERHVRKETTHRLGGSQRPEAPDSG
nr:MAG TPA: hypothetical protein [Caudoviricetes sp.]